MDAHVTQARRHGDRLVRDDPDLARKAVHAPSGSPPTGSSPERPSLPGRHDLAGDLVGVVVGVVELQVGDRTGRAADRLPVHPADEAEQGLGVREVTQDVVPLVVQRRAADLDQAGVVGPAVEAQLPQPRRIESVDGGSAESGSSPAFSWKRRTVGCSARFTMTPLYCIYNVSSEKNTRRSALRF